MGRSPILNLMKKFNTILYETSDKRARITLNRPEKRNALSMELMTELHRALWEADADKSVHVVILRAAGPSFCSGYDLSPPPYSAHDRDPEKTYRDSASFDDDTWRMEETQRLRMAIFDMHKPVIAQIHGHCIAGGTDLALLCDILIAADDAVIGFPPVRDFGSPPSHWWLYHVGPQWAKRLLLTGDNLSGSDAAKIGLVLKSVPLDKLEAEVESLADRMTRIDPDLLSANKRIVNVGLELMGARTLQRLAVENDTRGHTAPAARAFVKSLGEIGVKASFQARDAKFGDGFVRVDEPDSKKS